jgi:thiamine biosynthesis lipoprotein
MRLWGFRSGTPRVPADDEISEILEVTGLSYLRLDPEGGRARFARSGVSIDLGGIAKGYALDRGKMAARSAGATAGLFDLGGNLIVFGDQAGGEVGIQHPLDREKVVARISLRDRSVATSGGYEKYVTIDGTRYSHIIDPRTGHPADALASVTVVAEEGTAADALATACVVLGRDACFRLIRKRDQTEVAIVRFEGESLQIEVSEGLALLDP